jgi:hypothetical protein
LSFNNSAVVIHNTTPGGGVSDFAFLQTGTDMGTGLMRAPLNSGGGSPSPLEIVHRLPHEFVSADQQNLYKMSVAEDVRKCYIPQGIDVGIDVEDSAAT